MKEVLQYLVDSSIPLIEKKDLEDMVKMSQYEWQTYADKIKGMVVTYPGKKPCSVRVDQLDRNIDHQKPGSYKFPEIVHFGIRPPQLSYAGNPDYQKAWRDYVKFRHLLANMSKPTFEDKRKLESKENKLQEMRTQGKMKRDITVAVSAEGFYRTGIMCDIIQHAMLIPVLVCHLRFHHSLNILEDSINYKFKNRALLQLALTHPSYRENFGTNPDHARNSLTNCGIRQPEYGDRRIHYMNTRKRGINTLINIMSRFGKQHETESNITHNERLEFLGDAVVEFLSSIHLFYTFPDLEEGGLATYRAAIVQNQHLAVLAKTLKLDQFMLYAHGSDLCHDLELRHAMANCFEALMGALFLDGGIDVVDRVFSETLFKIHPDLLQVWMNLPPHPLQEQEPTGDRQWIPKFELLQNLTKFEESVGLEFNHIRLLARAFTDRSVGYTNLTLGSNQRLEFLGDTVLQLIASEYLYKYFPEHHEGHLSLLRSSLVNNRTQAVVCDDLGMSNYAVYNNPKAELKTKDRADLLEAFIGALYVDQGLQFCEVFCQVTLFPRLQDFIMNQDWNDPKSKLQQCCLTLRTMDGGEPDIPVYKVIECKGPTNTRVYTVAVYFRGRRLASAMGHSIQQAEMNAAKKALEISQDLFPQLDHQKRVIAKSMKKQKNKKHHSRSRSVMSSFGFASKSPERYSRRRFNKSKSRSSSNSDSSPRSKGDKKRWYGSSDNELSDER
jgi:ribonuclease-3